ncbi:MAG: hypothetical protein FP826_07230 [Sphingomonadales bacterium]|nr:hypothetical protein [Sphingomonadales bacterium]MBU3991395.1 hypothetical protein [Alphaproteobacteria bacterium]
MIRFSFKQAATAGSLGMAALLASCATKAPPPPPPPPITVVIPPKPVPPRGAADNFTVPAIGADGVRQTVNAHLSAAQTTWNLRSALNVAALNCVRAEDADILAGYKSLLKEHGKSLTTANKALDQEFRQKYGSAYIAPRERYMTQVYNYFALPPTRERFCTAARAVAREAATVKKGELEAFAARSLPQLESVYEAFFQDYEKYRHDLAAWQAQYGARTASPSVSFNAPLSGSSATPRR